MGDTNRTVNIVIKAKNEAGKAIDTVTSSLTSVWGAAVAAGAAVGYMAVAFTKVTEAAIQQENADVRLAAALASIGQNTAKNREHLNRYISQLEDITGVSDEAIQSAVALLAQLGQLSGQGLEQATQAALDLSAALGIDLQSAAQLVAKAAEGNTAALRRYGIVVDDAAAKTDHGAAALKKIQERFGGAAEAAGTTFAAALARIANSFDNLEQAIGKAVVENSAFRALLTVVNELLKQAQTFVEGNTGAFQQLVTWTARGAIAMLKFALEIVNAEARVADINLSFLQFLATLASLASVAPAIFEKIFGVGGETAKLMAEWGGKSIAALQRMKGVAGDVADATAGGIKAIEEALSHMADNTGPKLDKFGNQLGGTTEAIQNLTEVAGPTQVLQGFDAVLDALGLETLPRLEDQARLVDYALEQLNEQFQSGAISPEVYDSILAAITQITQQLPQWSDGLTRAAQHASELHGLMKQIEATVKGQVTSSVLQLSDALVDAAFGAKVSWGQFFRQLLADLIKAIARILILQALAKAFGTAVGGGAGGAVAGQFVGGVISGATQGGGVLDYYSPAQGVLPSATTLSGYSGTPGGNTEPGAGPSPGWALQMFNKIEPIRDRESEVADLITDLNRFVERRGYRLVASHVVA